MWYYYLCVRVYLLKDKGGCYAGFLGNIVATGGAKTVEPTALGAASDFF